MRKQGTARKVIKSPTIIPLDLAEQLDEVMDDPVLFSKTFFNHDHWGLQQAILRSCARHPRTTVKACHASGKTFTAADAVIYWVSKYPDGIVITTAPTWTQVKKLLWGEIHKTLEGEDAKLTFPKLNETELILGPNNYAIGLSTNEGVNFQGWHGTILIILDEAPGVRPDIHDAIEGIRAAGKVHVLMLGNPILAGGPFHASFTTQRSSWKTFTISAFDTPNLKGWHIDNGLPSDHPDHYSVGDFSEGSKNLLEATEDELDTNPIPYLTSRRWVYDKYHDWGSDHPLWESKVLGEFPKQSENSLISLSWIERAAEEGLVLLTEESELYDAGLDVAGPGENETVLTIRRGPNIVLQRGWAKPDPRGEVVAVLKDGPWAGKLRTFNIDEIGIGWGIMLHMKDIFGKKIVRGINVGDGSRLPERFKNLKAELYWGLRERFKSGQIAGLTNEKAQGQLATIRYEHTPHGLVKIESKEDMISDGIVSPDYAESTMLAYAPPTARTHAAKEFAVMRR